MLPGLMTGDWTVWAIPLVSAALGSITTIVVTTFTQSGTFRRDYLSRLARDERRIEKLLNERVKLKGIMQSVLLEHEIIMQACPKAEDDINNFYKRLTARGEKNAITKFRELMAETLSEDDDDEKEKGRQD
jgi:hypothetical protein